MEWNLSFFLSWNYASYVYKRPLKGNKQSKEIYKGGDVRLDGLNGMKTRQHYVKPNK